ncbi:MAG: serine/threonine-protein phosphatase [Candidatus Omnitrophica bacterium]|nr:serine/threonine-protein phosphatase [Candidatus Omnitrophota bacterium]MCA9441181.1 serine/threonine-protein phosphatase [Candidatus Omnitrophota bacterium]
MNSSTHHSFSADDSSDEPLFQADQILERISNLNQRLNDPESLSPDELLELVNTATTLLIHQERNMQALKGGYEEALAKLNLEMSQVRDVQESLLPEYPPEIEGLDFACEYLPSGHASGDYYDFLTPTDELVGSFVADVSGHGAPSAVVMAITRVLVQEHLRSTQSAGEALSKINSLMHRFIPGSLYVTGVYLLYNHQTHDFQYATAGHPAPIIWRNAEKKAAPLPIKARFPLKFLPEVDYESLESHLDPGDLLVFYTDGITELTNGGGEMVEQAGLLQWVENAPKETASGFLWGLLDQASCHTGGVPPEDDFTVVVLRREE